MGTTLCAIVLLEDDEGQEEIGWVNVGDSRIYLFRDGDLIQLSDDHSLVSRARSGTARSPTTRRRSTRSATSSPGPSASTQRSLVDSNTVHPLPGRPVPAVQRRPVQRGRPRPASPATLRRLADPTDAADDLVRLANEHGGRDNMTCVVVDVVDDGGPGRRSRRPRWPTSRTPVDWVPRPGRPAPRRRPRDPDASAASSPPRTDDVYADLDRRAWPARHLAGGGVRARAARDRRRGLRRGELVRPSAPTTSASPATRSPSTRAGPAACSGSTRRSRTQASTVERRPSSPSEDSRTVDRRPRRRRAYVSPADAKSFANTLRSRRPRPRAATPTTTTTATVRDDHRPAVATDRRPPDDRAAAPQHRARPDRARSVITGGAYTLASLGTTASIPANIGPFLGVVLGLLARRPPRRPPAGAGGRRHPAAAGRAAQRHRLRVHRPARQDLAGLQASWTAVGIGAFVAHARWSCAGSATSSATATRSARSASACCCCRSARASAATSTAPASGSASARSTSSPASSPRSRWPSSSPSYLVEKRELLGMATWPRRSGRSLPDPQHLGPVLLAWARVAGGDDRRAGPRLVAAVLRPVRGDALGGHGRGAYLGVGAGAVRRSARYVVVAHVRPRAGPRRRSGSTRGPTPTATASRSCRRCSRWPWGGVTGTGLGLGNPDRIPAVETDFIFAAIGEELGLLGGTAVADRAFLLIVGRRPAHRRRGPSRRSTSCWPPASPRSSACRRSSSSAASPGCSR